MVSKSETLQQRITNAKRELDLARRDGSSEWIHKAAEALDSLMDMWIPPKPKPPVRRKVAG